MATNAAIINAIINGASEDFKSRVPLANQTSFAESANAILEYEVTRNEFVNALVNKIAFSFLSSKAYTNPFKMLIKGTVALGKSVEQIFVDVINEAQYDVETAEQELFKRVKPPVSAIYHTVNRQGMYKITVEEATLRQAMMNESGLQNMVNGLIQTMTTSDEYDTFLYMKNLFNAYAQAGNFYPVVVTNPVDEQTVRQAVIEIKAMSNKFTFMNDDFNSAGVTTHAQKREQVLFINPDFDARVDVELLAQAFNMSKAEFEQRKILTDDFGGLTDTIAVLVDADWMQVWNQLYEMRSVENAQGLYWNYFLHHWQILSTSRFANAVIFQTTTPTVTAIDLTPDTATVLKGDSLQFSVVATGTNNPPSKCTYEVDGTDSYISPTGLLYVGKSETTSPLTVTATNVFNDSVTDTATITVS